MPSEYTLYEYVYSAYSFCAFLSFKRLDYETSEDVSD